MKRFFFIIIFLFLFALTAFAQNPSPTPPVSDDGTLKISTNLIQVDVTVTDKDGKIVTDLKPEDFEIFENGQKQEITNFSFISINPQQKQNENMAQEKNSTGQISIPIPPVKLKAEQVRRTYALVIDDLGLSFGNVYWVQQSLKKFVNEKMQEGDLVAIIRTGSGIGAMQSFTSDKRQLLATIDKLRWNPQGRGGISTFSPIGTTLKEDLAGMKTVGGGVSSPQGIEQDKEFEREVEEFRNENFSVGTLGALNYVIRGMRDLPGRKAIMLFSEGFVLTSKGAPNQVLDGMRVLADIANRASVVIYTLDPRGLQVPGMANADDVLREVIPLDFDPANYEDGRTQREIDFRDTQQSLRYLAYQTGGIPFINQNNLDKGLQKAIDDQSSYYLLGYQPDADTFDPKKNRFNKLEVKIKRPGLKVRYRSGFFAITDEKIRTVTQNPQQKLISALTSPFNASGIDLSLYPIYGNDAKDGDFIRALVYIDPKNLNFSEIADGKRKVSFDLVAMTFGDNGVPVDKLSKNYTLEVTEKDYQNLLKKGLVYDLTVPIKKAGAYQFRIAVRDANTDKVGSASQFIDVPNLKKRKLALSNIIVDNFSAAEWAKVSRGEKPSTGERNIFVDTTSRSFRRGSVLQYNYAIYNFKSDKPEKAALKSQLRLIRDGKVVFEGAQTPVNSDGQTDLQRIQASGAMSLGNNLEAGNYILQIVIFDMTNAGKPRIATQFVEFEIVN